MGAYLEDPDLQICDTDGNCEQKTGVMAWPRFFFDNLFKLILVILLINMVAGIIIDKFGALKDEFNHKMDDMTQYCFVCGIDREKLDKSSNVKQYYLVHIKVTHLI